MSIINKTRHSTSFPREFWLIVLIMLVEPLCATVIYPFINAFVRESGITGGDNAKTGYYAGIIVRLLLFQSYRTGAMLRSEMIPGINILHWRTLLCHPLGPYLRYLRPPSNPPPRPSRPLTLYTLFWPLSPYSSVSEGFLGCICLDGGK